MSDSKIRIAYASHMSEDDVLRAVELTGSIPGTHQPGTRLCKINSSDGDAHKDGARCTVLGSQGDDRGVIYCVRFDDGPAPVFVVADRVELLETWLDARVSRISGQLKFSLNCIDRLDDRLDSISKDRRLAREQLEERIALRVTDEVEKKTAALQCEVSRLRTSLAEEQLKSAELAASKKRLREALNRVKGDRQ